MIPLLIAEFTVSNLDVAELGLGGVSLVGVLFALYRINERIIGNSFIGAMAENVIPKVIKGATQAIYYMEIILAVATRGMSQDQMQGLGNYLVNRGNEIVQSGDKPIQ